MFSKFNFQISKFYEIFFPIRKFFFFVLDNNLVVSGEKKSDFQESRDGFYRYESSFGSFQRVILVGTKVREHDVKANMKNGVLELRFPAAVMTQEEQQRLNGGQELQQNSRSIHID